MAIIQLKQTMPLQEITATQNNNNLWLQSELISADPALAEQILNSATQIVNSVNSAASSATAAAGSASEASISATNAASSAASISRGTPNGIAPLDSNGLVPTTNLPIIGGIVYSDISTSKTSSTDYAEVKAVVLTGITGSVSVSFNLAMNTGDNVTDTAYGQIYVNGIAVGTEHTTPNPWRYPVQFSQAISIKTGDRVSVYAKSINGYDACVSQFIISASSGISATKVL